MKTIIFKLASLFLTIGLILISFNASSQDNRISRQEKKEAKRDRQFYNFQVLDSLLERRSFVLEADFLENQYGNRIPVLSNLNFIMVDSTNAVLQTGSNSGEGYNGVGGTTAEGSIERLKIVKDFKNLGFSIRFTVVTNIGVYDVSMTINSSNYARATITGLTRGKLVYDGRIETLYNSGVYKGRNTI
jgi:Domain of unknown function (DUF4251)